MARLYRRQAIRRQRHRMPAHDRDPPVKALKANIEAEIASAAANAVGPAEVDHDGRHYPRMMSVPRDRVRELELALQEQWAELSARCTQIADLVNVQQQQAEELKLARDAIEGLDKSVGLLRAALTQQESEAAAALHALALANEERAALAAELDKARSDSAVQIDKAKSDSAVLLQRALDFKTAFHEREATLAAARQKIEALEAELAIKSAELERLSAPIEEEQRRHRAELTQQTVRFEIEVARLRRLLEERDKQVDTLEAAHTTLSRRCEGLTVTATALEVEKKITDENLKSQAELIQVLEALLKVERETAEQKITELTLALEQERTARAASERISATMRKDIVQLLPKLVARRSLPAAPQSDTPPARTDAA